MIMTYQETLEWMFNKLPMYQRIGAAAYKADLNNTIQLLDLLVNPHNSFKSVHVAGTNGKGSVSHTLASVFQEAGYKTGLYTSPHLRDFRERIRINGEMIPEENVVQFIDTYKDKFEAMELSFFEMTVGMAFDYFRNEKVDIAIVEVGMGGRLDSTNLITPELSVITNIDFDHMKFLGDTRAKSPTRRQASSSPTFLLSLERHIPKPSRFSSTRPKNVAARFTSPTKSLTATRFISSPSPSRSLTFGKTANSTWKPSKSR